MSKPVTFEKVNRRHRKTIQGSVTLHKQIKKKQTNSRKKNHDVLQGPSRKYKERGQDLSRLKKEL